MIHPRCRADQFRGTLAVHMQTGEEKSLRFDPQIKQQTNKTSLTIQRGNIICTIKEPMLGKQQ
ncbi:hypothetical protein L249_3853 [Ophiocordyceps polyrhachis-furcata BCC 54312]|uniref:Uncharacterized protein n=1 Tax=Ophiocordyceps polyrhachis-furcata BCC 54312 TaxID=1330021 RepID=A0A367L609_9HYPO|nr:hypothetical protein L249_3853 [Ophiocordyceps polyrhachis-furcata BCC 54312]